MQPAAALVALISLLVVPALAASTPAQVTADFYHAFARGDVSLARGMWAPEGLVEFERRYARAMTVRCMRLHRADTRLRSIEGPSATVDLDADLSSWSEMPGDRGRIERVRLTFTLKQRQGEWRISAWREPEQELADAIIAGKPWREVFATDDELRTRILVRRITHYGVSRSFNDDTARARDAIAVAIEIADVMGDYDALSEAVGARSILECDYDPAQAVRSAEEALELSRRGGNADVVARGFLRLGRAKSALAGREVREPYDEMLAMAPFIESYGTLTNAATNLSSYFAQSGDYRSSLVHGLAALRYAQSAAEATAQMSAMLNLGAAYQWQGDDELSIPYWERAIELSKEANFPSAAGFPLRMLAHALYNTGRVSEARARLDQLTTLAPREPTILLTRGALFLDMGELDCARADLHAGLHSEPGILDRAMMWVKLSALHLRQEQYDEALQCARIANSLGDLAGRGFAHASIASALWRLGDLEGAETHFRAELSLQAFQRQSAVPELRQLSKFSALSAGLHSDLAGVLVDLGKPIEAIEVIESLRARILLDLESRAIDPTAGGPRDQLERRRLEQRIVDLNTALLRAPEETRQKLRASLTRARLDLDRFLAQSATRVSHPPPAPTYPIFTNGLKDTAIVEFFVAPERVVAFTIIYDKDGVMNARAVPLRVDPKNVGNAIDALLTAIERRDIGVDAQARALYAMLLAPIEPLIARSKSLCMIPDGALWRLPFHVFRTSDGTYLGERHTLYYAPSLAFLAIPREERNEQRPIDLLALANATIGENAVATIRSLYRDVGLGALPDAEREVDRIRAMYSAGRSYAYVGRKATEAVFKADAERSRVLHVATHGILDSKSPLYSALLLASSGAQLEDGLLEAREIASLRLNADIAVLSACETGSGFEAGEGIAGIAWAFMAAGCPTTVVSQWKAESKATSELMIEFHKHLSRGTSPAEALQRATKALRENPRYAHPLYWAPFIVVGANREMPPAGPRRARRATAPPPSAPARADVRED